MKTGFLVGVLTFIAGLRIFLQGYFDIINSIILVLGFMWTVRQYLEGKIVQKKRLQEEKLQKFMNQETTIDITDDCVIKEDLKGSVKE